MDQPRRGLTVAASKGGALVVYRHGGMADFMLSDAGHGEDFTVSATARGQDVVITLAGTVDLVTVHAVRDRIYAMIPPPPGKIIVDLGSVGFIESTGLGMLAGIHRRLDGRAMHVRGATHRVREILAVTGLDQVFVVED